MGANGIFMSYCRHQQTKRALQECDWLSDMSEDDTDVIADCARLQKYIIELAEQFGCEITNKQEVLQDIDDTVDYLQSKEI